VIGGSRHLAVIAIVVVIAAVIGGLVVTTLVDPASVSLEEAHVRVELSYTGGDRGEVIAVFRPPDGFHLFGPDVPPDGVDGLGRPTLLEVAPGSAWSRTGVVGVAPRTTLMMVPTSGHALTIFPDGPVTLRLPIARDAPAAPDARLTVMVTYMACDFSRCLAPVVERQITVPTRS
jgi:hypothetical protein